MSKNHRKKHNSSLRLDSRAYKHTATAIIFVSLFVLLLDTAIVQLFLSKIVNLGYLGIVLSGVLFVSFFTVVPAVVLLMSFAETYDPIVIALLAGIGAMLGDWLILRFAEDPIARELKPIAQKLKLMSFINLLHKKRLKPITVTLGSVIVASPLPDEAGIALLGLSHISTLQLLGVTFILNTAGIFVILTALN